MKFKVLGGNHSDSKGKVYKKGDIVESVSDLRKVFVNKFEKVADEELATEDTTEAPATEDAPVADEAPEVNDNDAGEDDAPEAAPEEDDVTEEFPIAVENKIKVVKTKGWYNLFDTTEDDAQINEKGLRAAAVEAEIEDYLEG